MPLDFKVERIRVVTGSMEYTFSAVAVTDPNGVVTEPSGSIVRSQDGRVWMNTTGGTVWQRVPESGTIDSAIKAAYAGLQAGTTASIGSIYTTILAGTSASDGTYYTTLQTGVSASISTLSGTINARFVDVTGSLVSSISSTNSSLRAGVTASFGRWPSDLSVAGSTTGSGDSSFGRDLRVAQDVYVGRSISSVGAANQGAATLSNGYIGQTSTTTVAAVSTNGTYDTTLGPLATYGVFSNAFASRSNGPQPFNQIALAGVTSGTVAVTSGVAVYGQAEGGLSASYGVFGAAFRSTGINYGGYFTNENPYGLPKLGTNYALFATGTVNIVGDLYVTGIIFGLVSGSGGNADSVYSSLQTGVTSSINGIYSTILAGTSASDAAVYSSLQTGVTSSVQAAFTSLQAGATASIGSIYTTILAGTSASDGTYYATLQTGVSASISTLSGTINSRFVDVTGSLISSVSSTNSSLRTGVTASINAIYSTILAGTSASDGAVQTSLKAGVSASLQGYYSTILAGTSASDGTYYTTILAGTSGSDSAVYSSLQTGVSSSISTLSGTINARFLDVTGSLISGIANTNSSLKTGVTASLQSYYTTILAGTSASDGTYYTTLQTGVSASISSLSGTINARFVDVTGSLISSIASTNSSLRAGVTASFANWGSDLSVLGSVTGSGDALFSRGVVIQGADSRIATTKTSLNVLAGFTALSSSSPVYGASITVGGNYDTTAFIGNANGLYAIAKGVRNNGTNGLWNFAITGEASGSEGDSFNIGLYGKSVGTGTNAGVYGQAYGGQSNYGGYFEGYNALGVPNPAGSRSWALWATGTVNIVGDLYVTGTIFGGNISTSGGTFQTGSVNLGNLYVTGSITGSGDVSFSRNLIVAGTTLFGVAPYGYTYILNDEIDGAYNTNGAATLYINYHGYQAGSTQFRDLSIRDGKTAEVALFEGATKKATFRADAEVVGQATLAGVNTFTNVGGQTNGMYVFGGNDYSSIVNWNGDAQQPVYIRAGKVGGRIIIGDVNTGSIAIGNSSNGVQVTGSYVGFSGPVLGSQLKFVESTAGRTTTGISPVRGWTTGTVDTSAALIWSYGVHGISSTGRSAGSNPQINYGVFGQASNSPTQNFGGRFEATGSSSTNIGVYGSATGASNNYGGYFSGKVFADNDVEVQGSVTGSAYMVNGSAGKLLVGVQQFTANGTYTPTAGTRAIRIRMVGGGGGGGSRYNATISTVSAGGAGGMYVEKFFSSLTSATGSVIVGAAGAGGNNSTGATGGDTALGVNGVTYVAKGGPGGQGTDYTNGFAHPGRAQTVTQTVDVQHQQDGQAGMLFSYQTAVTFLMGGAGGSGPFGSGGGQTLYPGNGTTARQSGRNATGYGGGGAGAIDGVASGGVVAVGGSGSAGLLIIEEYA